jgi:demethylmenaquinone methyltransferase/2-methoxy-6-polyprenyl-1,4-benzoquinol methylase
MTMKKYPSVKEVDPVRHVAMVKEIFSTIPERYDFLNHLFSLRRDVAWRRFAARRMGFFRLNRFLDVATGTADLAIETALRHPEIRAIGLDFTEEMMDLGRDKVARRGLSARIRFLKGNALHMPFSSGSFDAAGIAFGIRNIPNKGTALREMQRVVVPGGQVLVLEMNFPKSPFFRPLYHVYLNTLMPLLTRAVSPNPDAYRYLSDSIMNFPRPEGFKALMEEAGLCRVETHALTLGITYLYVGYKPDLPG